MASGKYTRVDGRKSTNYCTTFTIAVFVALCLVGVWMLTSSEFNFSPLQTVDFPSDKQKSQVKRETKDVNHSNSKPFEDSAADLPEHLTNGDENENSTQHVDGKEKSSQQESNKPEYGSQETKTDSDGSNLSKDKASRESEKKTESIQKENLVDRKHEGKEAGQIVENVEHNQNEVSGENSREEGEPKAEGSEEVKLTEDNLVDRNQEQKQGSGPPENVDQNQHKESGANSGEAVESEEEGTQAMGKTDVDLLDGKPEQNKEGHIVDTVAHNQNKESGESSEEEGKPKEEGYMEVLPSGAQLELLNESSIANGTWATQATESKNEKEGQASRSNQPDGLSWKLCDTTAGPDFIPCLDNLDAIRHLKTTKHYEHRERHCPAEPPTCLIPLPPGYKRPIEWPRSREKIWYSNVPHTKLAEVKGHQNWVKVSSEFLTFPGGGTQFKHGALHYIEFIEHIIRSQNIEFTWGKSSRVVLDVGCGVASFGGFLFEKDVLTMSLAPKDEHEAQVQFALERGIPAILAVMGTKRLPFPSIVFDAIHCARCRVPWHIEGGKLLLELNRILRPGGFFIWSATPVYWKNSADVEIWNAMSKLTKSMCWELVAKDKDPVNRAGVAVYRKPTSNECYEQRSQSEPAMCPKADDSNAAWSVPLQTCMHSLPQGNTERGSQWPINWPARMGRPPHWLTSSQLGVYGKSAPDDFTSDYAHWKRVVSQSYLKGLGISWFNVRNVMDMRSVYGGFAAALREMDVWVLNVVNIDSPDTLPIIYERGLFGIYHDWCESFSTYPRTYDLLHADHLFSKTKKKCNFLGLVSEVDRILRPEGKLIVRDNVETINELESALRSMKWDIRMTYSKNKEGLLCAQKTTWRPSETERLRYAIA